MWLFIALFSTVTNSLESILMKRNAFHFNAIIITWSLLAISSIMYLPVLIFSINSQGFPALNQTFWIALILRIIFDSLATVLFVKAIKLAPISLVIPMTAFTPVLVIFTSFFINHLFPSVAGIIGIITILFGVYYLNFDHDTKHLLSPFKAIGKEKGILVMLWAVLLFSLVTSLKRLGIDNSNQYFYTSFAQIVWAIMFTPVAYFSSRKQFHNIFQKHNIIALIPIGILDATQVLTYNIALKLSIPAYVGAIRSTSILFASLFAWLAFKEKLQGKIIPISIIVVGIVIISFSGSR